MNQLKDSQFSEGTPLYLQVRSVVMSELARGRWKPGEQLPTESELSAQFGVSEGTVRQALGTLVKEGRLTRRSGKGTFVAKRKFDQSFARFFRFRGDDQQADSGFRLDVIDMKTLSTVDPAIKTTLGLKKGAKVLAIHRTITQDEVVVCHYVSYLSHAEFGALSREDMNNSALYDALERRFRVHIVEATETLRARAANAEDAAILGVKKGEPVIAIERVAHTYGERVVEFRQTTARSDKFRYQIQLS